MRDKVLTSSSPPVLEPDAETLKALEAKWRTRADELFTAADGMEESEQRAAFDSEACILQNCADDLARLRALALSRQGQEPQKATRVDTTGDSGDNPTAAGNEAGA